MNLKLTTIILLLSCVNNLLSQDYFEDINGNSTPISRDDNGYYLGARANIGDNSLKFNIFRLYCIKDAPGYKNLLGWGSNLKGKIENGLGTVISGTQISPGLQVGGYLAFQRLSKGERTHCGTLIGYSNYSISGFQIFDSTQPFAKQIYDTIFRGFSYGISYFHVIPCGKDLSNNIIPAISIEMAKKNNYSNMDEIEINTRKEMYDPVTGKTYSYNDINENGNQYGMGMYNEFLQTQVKLSCGWIPSECNARVAFIPYASVKFIQNKKENYSLGLGIHFLEEGNPGVTIAGLTFEFTDISNSKGSKDIFLKRSFKISLNAALSTFSLR